MKPTDPITDERFGVIYRITNSVNGKIYVGQTVQDRETRFSQHISYALRGGKEPLARAIRKHGKENFVLEVLEEVPRSQLDAREVHFIAALDARNPQVGYNVCVGGGGMGEGPDHPCYGREVGEEERHRLSEAHSLRWSKMSAEDRLAFGAKLSAVPRDPEWLARMSASLKGRIITDEQRAKMSDAGKRRAPITEETRRRMSAAAKGRKHTEEAKAAMRVAQSQRPPVSEETRAKMSAARKGKKLPPRSEEWLRNQTEGIRAVAWDPERRRRISEAAKARWADPEKRSRIMASLKRKNPATNDTDVPNVA